MSTVLLMIFGFLLVLNLATAAWTFKSEFDIHDDCRWFSSVPSERRLKLLREELSAADSYPNDLMKDSETLRQLSRLDPKTFELLKQLCEGRPLNDQAEYQGNRIDHQALGDGVASRIVKQRRGPNGFGVLGAFSKRKPAKSAPTELDPTFMLMGIGRRR